MLILDTINFGSGWFGELGATTDGLTERLTAHARAERPWTATELRALDARHGRRDARPRPAEHQLTRLYSAALNHLGAFLGHRPMAGVLGDSAEALAERLAAGMPFFDDRGFYKRAQIAANDLHLAGVVSYPDVDRLTIFADNLVPHVLRLDGVLRYSDELAAGDRRRPRADRRRRVRARAARLRRPRLRGRSRSGSASPPRLLDNWLWNRGQHPPYSERPAHITRTVYY